MANITIKDLSDSVDLDRKAMQEISGGARYRAQAGARGPAPSRGARIVDFRTGTKPMGAEGAQSGKPTK